MNMKPDLDRFRPGQRIVIKKTWHDIRPVEGEIMLCHPDDDMSNGCGEMDIVCIKRKDGSIWTTLALNLIDGSYHKVEVFE